MKIYSKDQNVLQAALKRINRLFDEFPDVVVSFSGGKDSTVVLNLTLQVARERNRLPITVIWIDQEAEWQATVDYCDHVMRMPEVRPMWFQMPMVITNNASSYNRYNYCWEEGKEDKWIHPKSPISIKENRYGTDRFHELFERILSVDYKGKKTCYLAGVRTEESPKRFVSITNGATYEEITWGKKLNTGKGHYTFYPIYDWSYTDVWKYIHDNGIVYNRIYDEMYRYGLKLNEMRVSNLHHETAIQSLRYVQEMEPATWAKIAERIDGANAIKHLKNNSFTCPKELPYMFADWQEYAMHLAENIIQEQQYYDMLMKVVKADMKVYNGELIAPDFWKTVINTILSSDWDFTKIQNWKLMKEVDTYRRATLNDGGISKGVRKWDAAMLKNNKYLTEDQKRKVYDYFK